MIKKLYYLLTGLSILALAVGCSHSKDEEVTGPEDPSKNEVRLKLELTVPGISNPTTRALSKADETELQDIDLLIFKEESGQEYFLYQTQATNIVNNNGSTRKSFEATLQKSGGDRHRLVVIANARAEINAVKNSFTTSMTKEQVLKLIKFDTDDVWNTTSSTTFRPLPMWGETAQTFPIGTINTNLSIGLIKMLRAVARVDVGLNIDSDDVAQGFGTQFKLEDVKIYNANAVSLVVPFTTIENDEVKLPSLVDEPEIVSPPIAYSHAPADNGFIREIYVGEADNITKSTDAEMLCLVIGGYYTKDGDPDNISKKTWYRIDFYKRSTSTTAPQDRLDILRNHRYRVNITGVDGPGYDTEEEAFDSKPVHLETEIIVWDEGNMDNISSDGQYHLKVNKSSLVLYAEGNTHPQQIEIYTDHPDGWKISYDPGVTWIQVTPSTGNTAVKSTADVTADPYLNQPDKREAGFWIRAGKLKKWITVTQLNLSELSITVMPSSIVFRKSGSKPKSITVTTYPGDAKVYFTDSNTPDHPNPIVWLSDGFPVSGLSNDEVGGIYAFQPTVNGTENLLTALVTVYIKGEDGRIVPQTVSITQLATDMLFEAHVNISYPALAGTYSFTVDSDTSWSIGSVNDPNSALDGDFDDATKVKGTGTPYSFKLTNNNSWAQRIITYTPTSNDLDFVGQPFQVVQDNPKPTLTLDRTEVNYGPATAATTVNVKVTSNAKWKFTLGSVWGNMMDNPSPGANTDQGSHSYVTTTANTVAFKCLPGYAVLNSTPAANTPYATSATFTTTNHAPAGAASQTVTFRRVVPVYFNSLSIAYGSGYATVIPRTATVVGPQAFTNAIWACNLYEGTTELGNVGVMPASTYGAKRGSVTVPANNRWPNPGNKSTPDYRTITAQAYTKLAASDGWTAYTGQARPSFTQPGYYINANSLYTNLSGNIASGVVRDVEIRIGGAFPGNAVYTRIIDRNNTQIAMGPLIPAQENGSVGSAKITLPANASWTNREITIGYVHPGLNRWIYAPYVWQYGYTVTSGRTDPPSGSRQLSSNGELMGVYLTGYFPNVTVAAFLDDWTMLTSGTVPAGTGERGINITIPANAGGPRNIYIKWQHGNGNWYNIAQFVQAKDPWIIGTPGAYKRVSKSLYGPDQFNTAMASCGNQMISPDDWRYLKDTGDTASLEAILSGIPVGRELWSNYAISGMPDYVITFLKNATTGEYDTNFIWRASYIYYRCVTPL